MTGNTFDAYASTREQPRHRPGGQPHHEIGHQIGHQVGRHPARARRRWPLLLIGASAGTATWSGWVGLGELTGFGGVHPLPGIWDDLTLNTAITLPIGVEAYAVYALSVATDPRTRTPRLRRWAWGSAFAALLLGMAGQIAYHLLTPNARPGTPAWIVAVVSCLPVLVLGAASLLWHLTGQDHNATETTDPADDDGADHQQAFRALVDRAPVDRAPVDCAPVDRAPAAAAPAGPARRPSAPTSTVPTPDAVPTRSQATDHLPTPIAVPSRSSVGQQAPNRSSDRRAAGRARDRQRPGDGDHAVVRVDGDVSAQDEQIVAAIARTGSVPTVRQIKAAHRVGGSRAVRLRALAAAALAERANRAESTSTASGAVADGTGPGGSPADAGSPAIAASHAEVTVTDSGPPAEAPEAASPLQAEIEEFLQQIDHHHSDRPDSHP